MFPAVSQLHSSYFVFKQDGLASKGAGFNVSRHEEQCSDKFDNDETVDSVPRSMDKERDDGQFPGYLSMRI